jgi:GDPmannose 4,6-dehydratase
LDLDPAKYLLVDDKFFRPAEVNLLCGDYAKAQQKFGWQPKVRFAELVKMMVTADLARLKNYPK